VHLSGTKTHGLRVFGALPPQADAFQHRAIGHELATASTGGITTVLTGAGTDVMAGLGGVGKTQLASEYARRLLDTGELDLLMWVNATSRDAIISSYADAARITTDIDDTEAEQLATRFLAWLTGTAQRWLVVLDDIQSPEDVRGLWPPHTKSGRVIATTRRRDNALRADNRRIVDVGLFTPEEAVAYLAGKLNDREDESADELAGLADDLGYLPLALAQAAAFIADSPLINACEYRILLADQRRRLAELLPERQSLPDDHQSTVDMTWALSIELADRLAPAELAAPVLELATVLSPNGIPADVFTTPVTLSYLRAALNREVTAAEAKAALGCLHRLSLVTLDPGTPHHAVRVHSLVQRATREHLPDDYLAVLTRTAADALMEVWPSVERDRELGVVLRANAMALQSTAGTSLWTPGPHVLVGHVGFSLADSQQYEAAIGYQSRLLEAAIRHLGPDDPNTLAIRHNGACWRGFSGDVTGAVADLEQLLTDNLRVLGVNNPETLVTRNVLAYMRGEGGDHTGAVNDLEELLIHRSRTLGPDHPNTLKTRINLALARRKTTPSTAMTEYTQLIPDMERILGADHPDALAARGNFASVHAETGDAAGAIVQVRQLIPDLTRALGPEHPSTLTARNNLALWQANVGDLAAAISDFERLLPDMQRVLGSDHPLNLVTRTNFARCHYKAGNFNKALVILEQLLPKMTRVRGHDHESTVMTRANIDHLRKLITRGA
jgi:tetratricopeptide (TPR) repeat protein